LKQIDPPDIGQGVNSGLADVVALGTALEDVNLSKEKQDSSKPNLLGDAMKKFEDERLQEVGF
jgi:2-polyprenyl-6-methoxyphenol hydroxylase-like FAD-dependent oxidoreductase